MKKRMRSIDSAIDFKEFQKYLDVFMKKNNFSWEEIQSVLHLMNSYYFMGADIENFRTEG